MKKLLSILLLLPLLPELARSQTCTDLGITRPLINIQLTDSAEHNSGNHYVSTGVQSPGGPPADPGAVTGKCTYSSGGGANCDTSCSVAITGSTSNGETGSLNAAGTHTVGVGTASGSAAATNGGQSCAAALGGGAANCFGVSEVCLVSVTVSTGGVTISTNAHEVWKNSGSLALNCGAMPDPTKTVAGGGPVITDPCNDPSWAGLANDFSGPPPSGCFPSPIVIDTEGEGFHLTSAADGVTFDIRGDGHPIQIAWTAAGSHNAFLALDRNGDGKITSGKELFGNFTQQPVSAKPNGFLALEEFDQPENGGNGDGIIDERDTVFSQLVLWIDDNHDGVVQPSELHKLSEFGIRSLTLRYFESRRTDEFGNQFRYRARINPDRNHRDRRDETKSGEPGRWAYDVFFVTQ